MSAPKVRGLTLCAISVCFNTFGFGSSTGKLATRLQRTLTRYFLSLTIVWVRISHVLFSCSTRCSQLYSTRKWCCCSCCRGILTTQRIELSVGASAI
ncbi:hypothetical protein PR003_g31189 [Phytophthora rubi]|uniref:Uncharacterized protein n=1 Tax=Phytophthora rubi TaxID=129364 RepID=A0A6A4BAH8_9STRA|nr:hypothetical protein PR003_g31189 [Phytophthora rubi]